MPYGSGSPMLLLWTLMGYSRPYTIFTGVVETLGALLVFFRRTSGLGALILVAAMTNVVALNFCFDIPVKLLATNLLIQALFIAAPALRQLLDMLVWRRPTSPVPERSSRMLLTVELLLLGLIGGRAIVNRVEVRAHPSTADPDRPPFGTWQVEAFSRNHVDVPLVAAPAAQWVTVSTYAGILLNVYIGDGTVDVYKIKEDPAQRTIELSTTEGPEQSAAFSYSVPDAEHLLVDGKLEGVPVGARLRKIDTHKLELMSHPFHWISD